MHHVILNHYGDEFMVSSSVHTISKRNTQEGTKTHGMQLCDCDIAVTCFYYSVRICTTGLCIWWHRFFVRTYVYVYIFVDKKACLVPYRLQISC